MNIKIEKDEMLDFFLLYIKDAFDNINEEKESGKVLKSSALKQKLNIFETKVDDIVLLKYNQFKKALKGSIRILS